MNVSEKSNTNVINSTVEIPDKESKRKRRKEKLRKFGRVCGTILLVLILLNVIIMNLFRNQIADAVATGAIAGFSEAVIGEFENIIEKTVDEQKNPPDEADAMEAKAECPEYNALEGSTFPEKYDLRDVNGKNYVTSVKSQGYFGTCWAFATTAAAEISLMSELDMPVTYDAEGKPIDPIDLSELHTGWFVNVPVTDGEQAGEGRVMLNKNNEDSFDPKDVLNSGGFFANATALYKSGMGPVPAKMVPYEPKEAETIDTEYISSLAEGKDLNDEAVVNELMKDEKFAKAWPYIMVSNEGKLANWGEDGDWSVDDECRFLYVAPIDNTYILPSPQHGNPEGVNAMKEQLLAGRGIAIAYHADVSRADDLLEDREETYITFNDDGSYAQYTFDDAPVNHEVCVVGWDDTFPKENFNKDPDLCPAGDGAWIVKNSWGAKDNVFPNLGIRNGWGTDGTGYFYLSYYDHSIDSAECLDFDTESMNNNASEFIVDEYDFLVSNPVSIPIPFISISEANVFTAEYDETVDHLGFSTSGAGSKVTYEVYKLKDGWKKPTDGKRIEKKTLSYEYAGFHRVELDNPITVNKGETFSVIVTEKDKNKHYLTFTMTQNKEAAIHLKDYYEELGGEEESGLSIVGNYGVGIINPKESFLKVGKGWLDFGETVKKAQAQAESDNKNGLKDGGISYDNFSIKAYSTPVNPTQ